MRLNRIRIITLSMALTICFSSFFVSRVSAQCPDEFPYDCGSLICCTDGRYCPEEGGLWMMGQCTQRRLCPLATILGEDSEEAILIRSFRDTMLGQTQEGQELIKLYYLWSPVIVKAMEEDEDFKEDIKELMGTLLPMIEEVVE